MKCEKKIMIKSEEGEDGEISSQNNFLKKTKKSINKISSCTKKKKKPLDTHACKILKNHTILEKSQIHENLFSNSQTRVYKSRKITVSNSQEISWARKCFLPAHGMLSLPPSDLDFRRHLSCLQLDKSTNIWGRAESRGPTLYISKHKINSTILFIINYIH